MERELIYLLYDLCVKWGFCIPSDSYESIIKATTYSATKFAKDVVRAEGLDDSSEWINRIEKRFCERFGSSEIDTETFTGRILGIKENW